MLHKSQFSSSSHEPDIIYRARRLLDLSDHADQSLIRTAKLNTCSAGNSVASHLMSLINASVISKSADDLAHTALTWFSPLKLLTT